MGTPEDSRGTTSIAPSGMEATASSTEAEIVGMAELSEFCGPIIPDQGSVSRPPDPVAAAGILAYSRSKQRQYVPQDPPETAGDIIGSRQGGRATMTKDFTLDVNGKQHKVNVDPGHAAALCAAR